MQPQQPGQHNLSMPTSMDIGQLQASLAVSQGELGLWQVKYNALTDHGRRQRCLVDLVCRRVFAEGTKDELAALKRFMESHKTVDEAELQIVELQLAQLKAKCSILQSAIEELGKRGQVSSVIAGPHAAGKRIHIPGQ